ncbi:MAG: stage II sporulation protein M [Bacillota bacterium]|nr:stage II sporulation protein M [Bacillota bacterium]
MGKYKLTKDRLFVYICSLYVCGILFGVFLFRAPGEQNFGEAKFIPVFCANYWYVFLMWLFGFSVIGLFFNSLIIFFRGFLFGALLAVLIKTSFKDLAVLTALEIIVFIPAFFTLGYFSLASARKQFYNLFAPFTGTLDNKIYLNVMIVVTVVIVIYSLVIVIYR